MKNHVCLVGLLLVGVSLVNAWGIPSPRIGIPVPNPLNPKFGFNPPSLPGGPSVSVNASGSAGSFIEGLANPKFPQLPGLPGSGNGKSPFGIPGLPGAPSLPGIPGLPGSNSSSFGSLPGFPSLPGLPGSNSSSFGSLPGFPSLPGVPGLPGSNSSAFGSLPKFPSFPGVPGFPGSNSSNSSSFGNLPGVPNFFDPNGLASLLPNGSSLSPNSSLGSALDDIEQAVKQANNSFNENLSNLQDFSNNVANQINNASNAAQAQVVQQLQSVSSNVRKCVEKSGNPGQVGVAAAQQSALQCVEKKVNEGLALAANTQANVKAAQLGINYVRGNLTQCRVNVSMSLTELPSYSASSPLCAASALFSVTPETLLLPFSLANDLAQAANLAQGLQAYFIGCVANLMGDVAKAEVQNSLAIGKCYANIGN